ncbi:Hypothetical protein LUCI_2952 [Lucifera butyrica]|uniref:Four-carbon acid sugar kinase family protein n=1 Tax=Lucifera butyrica TaxID=1351585 RepID=A0A498R9Q4_9FIRM|nr:Hypothetical protein LUCI_2952 [Lucifera butyrica]
MIKMAVIADDLTGANDTAVQFAKFGITSCVLLDAIGQNGLSDSADVLVLDTDSRAATPAVAYDKVQRVCQTLQAAGVRKVYKKVDSTLRGNLGAEIEAAADIFQPELIVIAPAFPGNNRITIGSYHLLNQMPVSWTEIAEDPKSPVRESRLPELLKQQTKCKVGFIPLPVVTEGITAIQAAIATRLNLGEKWLVFDAVTDDNLRQIAAAAMVYNRVLWVGSAGLAERLPELYGWQSDSKSHNTPVGGPVLIVAGSVSRITRKQIEIFLQQSATRLIEVNASAVLNDWYKEVERCVLTVNELFMAGNDVVIASAVAADAVDSAVTAGGRFGLDKNEISNRIAVVLGHIAFELAKKIQLAGMVLTGGDTAVNVCRALGAGSLEILAEVVPGIPIGRLNGGPFSGMRVVTKAGAFGDDRALIKGAQAIKGKGDEEQERE